MTTTLRRPAPAGGHRVARRARRGHRRSRGRRRVPSARAARDQLRRRDGPHLGRRARHRHRRGGAADRRGPGALHLSQGHRRSRKGRTRAQHRPGDHGPGRRRRARPRLQRHGRALDTDDIGPYDDRWDIHRLRRRSTSRAEVDDVRDRGSRSSTSSSPTCRAGRSACSEERASERRCSSRR
jgi:hypothetical protein